MQKTFLNYKDPITSFGANEKYSGILWPNVYCGFDTIVPNTGLQFTLAHTKSGEVFTLLNQDLTNPRGIWVTKQGVVVKEDAPIPLVIESNSNNNSNRIDLLIGKHYHDVIYPGGVAASYEIIKGQLGGETAPIVPDPAISVVLGYFIVGANTTSIAGVKWVRNRAPVPGGKSPALLNEENRFTDQQQDYQNPISVQSVSTDYAILARGIITELNKGNLFIASPGFNYLDLLPAKPAGTTISILFQGDTTLRNFINNTVGQQAGLGERVGYTDGLRLIGFNNLAQDEILIKANQIVTFTMVNVGGNWTPNTGPYLYGDYWKLIDVSDSPVRVKALEANVNTLNNQITTLNTQIVTLTQLVNNINNPRQLSDIDYLGDLNQDFDSTGRAREGSPYFGKVICNGQNGSPDFRGRFKVSYSDYDNDYVSVGWIGGSKFVTLSTAQLPSHQHIVPYTAISGNNWGGGTNLGNRGYNSGTQATYQNALTSPTGNGESHENRPPYRVVLTLMWVGV